MTGAVTLYPNTVDSALFNDPRDAEVNALMAVIPKDRSWRLFGAGADLRQPANQPTSTRITPPG